MTEYEVAEQVAIAMRKRWGELDPDTSNLIPWGKSDKREIWIEIAKAGIDTYELAKEAIATYEGIKR